MSTRQTSHPVAAGSHARGSPLREIEKLLRERFSDLKSSLDEALDPQHGESVLDLLLGDQRIAVAWSPKRGFGVSSHADSEFGQRPDEVYSSAAEASERIKSLLLSRTKTTPPAPEDLAQLRRCLGVTQVALAKRMKVGQGAISKLESRPDALLSTLEAYFKALGADLQVVARTPRGVFPLRSLGTRKSAGTRSRS
jgi:DNA-binding transcriptional regulator YiaG